MLPFFKPFLLICNLVSVKIGHNPFPVSSIIVFIPPLISTVLFPGFVNWINLMFQIFYKTVHYKVICFFSNYNNNYRSHWFRIFAQLNVFNAFSDKFIDLKLHCHFCAKLN